MGSKKQVLKFLSKSNMVKPAASTGRLIRSKTLATARHQPNKGIFIGHFCAPHLQLAIVQIKLMLPKRLPVPAMCRDKIAKSTPGVL